jgi:hypothetical protein
MKEKFSRTEIVKQISNQPPEWKTEFLTLAPQEQNTTLYKLFNVQGYNEKSLIRKAKAQWIKEPKAPLSHEENFFNGMRKSIQQIIQKEFFDAAPANQPNFSQDNWIAPDSLPHTSPMKGPFKNVTINFSIELDKELSHFCKNTGIAKRRVFDIAIKNFLAATPKT